MTDYPFLNSKSGRVSKAALVRYVLDSEGDLGCPMIVGAANSILQSLPDELRADVSPVNDMDYYQNINKWRRREHPAPRSEETLHSLMRTETDLAHETSTMLELRQAREFLRRCGDDLQRAQTLLELVYVP